MYKISTGNFQEEISTEGNFQEEFSTDFFWILFWNFLNFFKKFWVGNSTKTFRIQKILWRIDAARRELSIYGVFGKIWRILTRLMDENFYLQKLNEKGKNWRKMKENWRKKEGFEIFGNFQSKFFIISCIQS